ncbi:hypothetical protein ABPG74_021429 [Tetrahymena malaccensis]
MIPFIQKLKLYIQCDQLSIHKSTNQPTNQRSKLLQEYFMPKTFNKVKLQRQIFSLINMSIKVHWISFRYPQFIQLNKNNSQKIRNKHFYYTFLFNFSLFWSS